VSHHFHFHLYSMCKKALYVIIFHWHFVLYVTQTNVTAELRDCALKEVAILIFFSLCLVGFVEVLEASAYCPMDEPSSSNLSDTRLM